MNFYPSYFDPVQPVYTPRIKPRSELTSRYEQARLNPQTLGFTHASVVAGEVDPVKLCQCRYPTDDFPEPEVSPTTIHMHLVCDQTKIAEDMLCESCRTSVHCQEARTTARMLQKMGHTLVRTEAPTEGLLTDRRSMVDAQRAMANNRFRD